MTLFMVIYHTCILGSSFKHMLTWMGFVHTDGWSVPDMNPVWPLNCPFLSSMNFKLDRGVSGSNGQCTLYCHCVYSRILYITDMLLWLHILNYSKHKNHFKTLRQRYSFSNQIRIAVFVIYWSSVSYIQKIAKLLTTKKQKRTKLGHFEKV